MSEAFGLSHLFGQPTAGLSLSPQKPTKGLSQHSSSLEDEPLWLGIFRASPRTVLTWRSGYSDKVQNVGDLESPAA